MPESDSDKENKKPATAPEVDPKLLTKIQKQRIEEEFDLEPETETESKTAPELKPAKAPAKPAPVAAITAVETAPAEAEPQAEAETEMPGVELSDGGSGKPAQLAPLAADMAAASEDLRQAPEQAAAKPATTPNKPGKHRIRNFFAHKKKVWIPLLFLAILGGLGGVPYTRYMLAGYVIKQPYAVTVTDAGTGRPITSASVAIDGQKATTDKDGKATLQDVKPGPHKLTVSKKYYQDVSSDVMVPLYGDKGSSQLAVKAIGRQVPLKVTDKISGKPLADVTLKSAGTEVKTDKDGKAVMVLPADKPTLEISLAANGFNSLVTRITVTDQESKDNAFAMSPSGRLFFLSKQSGKIDVVATNLDGSGRETVVYGTGKEEDAGTVLLASRDWKYLALYSKRDSDSAKLYLIDTSNNKMTTIEDKNAGVVLIGWSGHRFVYSATRANAKQYEAGYQSIKSYDAEKRQPLTLDQNASEKDAANPPNYAFTTFSNYALLGNKLVYTLSWSGMSTAGWYYEPGAKAHVLRQVPVDSNSGKKDVRTYQTDLFGAMTVRVYEPQSIYFGFYSKPDSKNLYFEYEDGEVKPVNITDQDFYNKPYPTYLFSPDSNKTFWNEQRDGKETFFVGDSEGHNGKAVGVVEDGVVYGWYGNDYLLASKKGSELYIMPVGGGASLKVSDYHKPQLSYPGYGGGYGGL